MLHEILSDPLSPFHFEDGSGLEQHNKPLNCTIDVARWVLGQGARARRTSVRLGIAQFLFEPKNAKIRFLVPFLHRLPPFMDQFTEARTADGYFVDIGCDRESRLPPPMASSHSGHGTPVHSA